MKHLSRAGAVSSRQTSESIIAESLRIPSALEPFDAVMSCDNIQAYPEHLLPSLLKPDRHLEQTITFHFQADRTRNSRDADGDEYRNGAEED